MQTGQAPTKNSDAMKKVMESLALDGDDDDDEMAVEPPAKKEKKRKHDAMEVSLCRRRLGAGRC